MTTGRHGGMVRAGELLGAPLPARLTTGFFPSFGGDVDTAELCVPPSKPLGVTLSPKAPNWLEEQFRRWLADSEAHVAARRAQERAQAANTSPPPAESKEEALQARRRYLRLCEVPAKWERLLLAGLDESFPALQAAKRWRDGPHTFLVLAGDPGHGKTCAALWLLEQGPRRPYPHPHGHFTDVWPSELHPVYIKGCDFAAIDFYKERERWRQLGRCSLLVIDEAKGLDVGGKNAYLARLATIYNIRHEHELCTIATMNPGLDRFRQDVEQEHAAFYDRLKEVAVWEEIKGPSRRRSVE